MGFKGLKIKLRQKQNLGWKWHFDFFQGQKKINTLIYGDFNVFLGFNLVLLYGIDERESYMHLRHVVAQKKTTMS